MSSLSSVRFSRLYTPRFGEGGDGFRGCEPQAVEDYMEILSLALLQSNLTPALREKITNQLSSPRPVTVDAWKVLYQEFRQQNA